MNYEKYVSEQIIKANRLSLNVTKTNYTLFHKNFTKDKLPLKIPEFKIGNSIIKRKSSVKFQGVMLDENISWKDDIKTIGKKLAKNIDLLYHIVQNYILMRRP